MSKSETETKDETTELTSRIGLAWTIANSVILVGLFVSGLALQWTMQQELDTLNESLHQHDARAAENERIMNTVYERSDGPSSLEIANDAMISLGQTAQPFDNPVFDDYLPEKPLPDESNFVFFQTFNSETNQSRFYLPDRKFKLIVQAFHSMTKDIRKFEDKPYASKTISIAGAGWKTLSAFSRKDATGSKLLISGSDLDATEIDLPDSNATYAYVETFFENLRVPHSEANATRDESIILQMTFDASDDKERSKKVRLVVGIATDE